MKLGQIVNEYRRKNKLSMDAFAKKSGISKGYIRVYVIVEKNPYV